MKWLYEASCWILLPGVNLSNKYTMDLHTSFEAHIQSSWVIQTGACRIAQNVHPETQQGKNIICWLKDVQFLVESRGKSENSSKKTSNKATKVLDLDLYSLCTPPKSGFILYYTTQFFVPLIPQMIPLVSVSIALLRTLALVRLSFTLGSRCHLCTGLRASRIQTAARGPIPSREQSHLFPADVIPNRIGPISHGPKEFPWRIRRLMVDWC